MTTRRSKKETNAEPHEGLAAVADRLEANGAQPGVVSKIRSAHDERNRLRALLHWPALKEH